MRATLKETTVRSVKPASIIALKVPAYPVPAPTPPLQVPATTVSWRCGFSPPSAVLAECCVNSVNIYHGEPLALHLLPLIYASYLCPSSKKFPSLPHLLVTPLSQLDRDTVNSIICATEKERKGVCCLCPLLY